MWQRPVVICPRIPEPVFASPGAATQVEALPAGSPLVIYLELVENLMDELENLGAAE